MHYLWQLSFEWIERQTMAAAARGIILAPIIADRVRQRQVDDLDQAIHEAINQLLAEREHDPLRPLPRFPAKLESSTQQVEPPRDGDERSAERPPSPGTSQGTERRGPGRPKKIRPEDLSNDRP